MKLVQQQRRASAEAFELCIREIRNIPGYERFLLGLTTTEMQACASKGSIIIINVTNLGSHAIIVSSTEIRSLNLPNLYASKARSWLNREWSIRRQDLGRNNREFRKYLSWLWEVCVKQVLIEGKFRVQPLERGLPRIWWIGTGLASSMPFHAAGDHSPRSKENTFSRAISSYTPSIKALAYARNVREKKIL